MSPTTWRNPRVDGGAARRRRPSRPPAAWPRCLPARWSSSPPPFPARAIVGTGTGTGCPQTPPVVHRRRRAPHRPETATLYRLSEGTVIDAVLTNRLDGTFPGPVNALVSTPAYAAGSRRHSGGARVLGKLRAVNTFGQTRLAVFHRLLLPSGVHIEPRRSPALNQVGDLGLHDQVDAHYGRIFGVSVALGLLSGFSQGRTTAGLDATAPDAYRQGVASNLGTSSTHVLDRFLNRLPTVTTIGRPSPKVYLTRDLDLPVAATARAGYGGVR